MPFKDPIKAREYHRAYIKRYFQNPVNRRHVNKIANDRAYSVRKWIDDFKISNGCVDCGYKANAKALHFDHVKGSKKLNVCNSKSVSQAKLEIKKCVVRCANCHCVITHLRLRKLVEKSHL